MVAPLIIGGAIAAGSSILGGMMNKSSGYAQWKRDADLQREFAQNSLQWRMQDAKKAGLHPTVAAGASPGQAPIVSSPIPDNGLSQAGQAVANTILQKKQADLIDAQISNINAQTRQLNEPLEIDGQETGINNIQPQGVKSLGEQIEREATLTAKPGSGQSTIPYQFVTPDGHKVPVSRGVPEFLNQLKELYALEEFAEIVGGYYALKDYSLYDLKKKWNAVKHKVLNKYYNSEPQPLNLKKGFIPRRKEY